MNNQNRIGWMALPLFMFLISEWFPLGFDLPATLNIAHRGASGHAPEHTMIAYQYASQMGADAIELDLQLSADGQLVVIHDKDLSRTTSGEGLVQEKRVEELKTLDAGSWFNLLYPDKMDQRFRGETIPLLEEVLTYLPSDTLYYLELKGDSEDIIDRLIPLIQQYKLVEQGRVVIQSFHPHVLEDIHRKQPHLPLVQLINQKQLSEADFAAIRHYAVGVSVAYQSLTPALIAHIKDEGLSVHAYTVNQAEEMAQLMEWGIDGIFTDYPDRFNEVLQQYEFPFVYD
ncbi:glycerophosphodiester phosphodiesterase [Gracilibacillus alcaliphilus]|uniref:glycerophosphodiester phosphodiesterase n=1 Tax=Gracilibacillus alcaliphilus TaxID=1401441 RepID=UPI00195B541A|nr:glycerophosphodiester phosphodiesterase family protein [Gracilibacillus alcaliphilus]MBM7676547.1 glycerophosphoryl diester phosphodiesterase [Gracilibacillus alcaliphilus]